MRTIPKEQVLDRLRTENPWWESSQIDGTYRAMRLRAYFKLFYPLVAERNIRRAVLLMGPRRVGKTVLIHHVIQSLIDNGTDPKRITYLAVDHPIYTGCGLEDLLEYCSEASNTNYRSEPVFVFLDEIQYLKDWEIQLKALVDAYPGIKFIASGSAAAALRLKSNESGAGRFTDFLLPPLTFHEYLTLLDIRDLVYRDGNRYLWTNENVEALNEEFLRYLNFGGYPEVIFSQTIQSDPARFIKGDIVDKVLLRDLPGLYGIQDIQELNYLFTTLAFNTANEISLDQLSQSSGAAKNTLKRYIEYLEAAFLIKIVHRIDRSARRFQRANFFKVYLTNPSMRSALFSPITENDEAMGSLAETGIFSQWFHAPDMRLHYARWNNGEVDIVRLDPNQQVAWVVEVKWSDRYIAKPRELQSLLDFCRENKLSRVTVTSKSMFASEEVNGVRLEFIPASVYCYLVGYNIVNRRDMLAGLKTAAEASEGI